MGRSPSHSTSFKCRNVLIIADNGIGMSEDEVFKYLSIGFSEKDGCHYGFGGTTSLAFIAGYSMVLSRKSAEYFSMGLLSTDLHESLQKEGGLENAMLPICSWDREHRVRQDLGGGKPARNFESRAQSLNIVLNNSPFASEHELLRMLHYIPASQPHATGTVLVMWNRLDDLYLAQETDIESKRAAPDAWPHETSLREYLSLLYYHDDEVKVRMRINLMGQAVSYRNWSKYLKLQAKDKYIYAPQSSPDISAVPPEPVTCQFGHRTNLADLMAIARGKSKDKDTSLLLYRGIFFYNKDRARIRLILPLQESKTQNPSVSTAMAVAERRICQWGYGLVGVCVESYLQPKNNKSEYDTRTPHFANLKHHVDLLLKRHLKDVVTPAFQKIGGGGLATVITRRSPQGRPKCRKQGKGPSKKEGFRMRAPDGVIGFTAHAAKGRWHLQGQDGEIDLSTSYRWDELQMTAFDLETDLPQAFMVAPAEVRLALDRAAVNVLWDDAESEERVWEEGTLHEASGGWFVVAYTSPTMGERFDVDSPEQLLIAIPAGMARGLSSHFVAFRRDGECLRSNKHIQLDIDGALKRARSPYVASLLPPPLSEQPAPPPPLRCQKPATQADAGRASSSERAPPSLHVLHEPACSSRSSYLLQPVGRSCSMVPSAAGTHQPGCRDLSLHDFDDPHAADDDWYGGHVPCDGINSPRAALAEKDQDLERLLLTIDQHEATISKKAAIIAEKEAIIEDQKRKMEQMKSSLELALAEKARLLERNQGLLLQEETEEDKQRKMEQMESSLELALSEKASLLERNEALSLQLMEMETEIRHKDEVIDEKDIKIKESLTSISSREELIAKYKANIKQRDELIAKYKARR